MPVEKIVTRHWIRNTCGSPLEAITQSLEDGLALCLCACRGQDLGARQLDEDSEFDEESARLAMHPSKLCMLRRLLAPPKSEQ